MASTATPAIRPATGGGVLFCPAAGQAGCKDPCRQGRPCLHKAVSLLAGIGGRAFKRMSHPACPRGRRDTPTSRDGTTILSDQPDMLPWRARSGGSAPCLDDRWLRWWPRHGGNARTIAGRRSRQGPAPTRLQLQSDDAVAICPCRHDRSGIRRRCARRLVPAPVMHRTVEQRRTANVPWLARHEVRPLERAFLSPCGIEVEAGPVPGPPTTVSAPRPRAPAGR